MEENNIMETSADTIPQQEPSAEQEAEKAADAGAPQPTEEQATANSSENETAEEKETPPDFGLEINYNHETRVLSRDDAAAYAQIGMKFKDSGIDIDTVKPLYNKLDYIAAQRGQTIEEVVDRLFAEDENSHRQELVDKFGEESGVIDDLMKVYREGQKQKYDKIVADRKDAAQKAERDKRESLEARLASEFSELKAEFPELAEFSQLPKEVKTDAANGRDLMSAYLRYMHRENKKIAAAKSSEETAAKATTGTAGTAENMADTVDDAFFRGLMGN